MRDIKGRFLWLDLMTSDPAGARAFYQAVVGWTTSPFRDDYVLFNGPRGAVGGSMKLDPETQAMGVPPYWMASIGTPDVDAAVAQVQALGGQVLAPAFDVPDVGRVAVVTDPSGAAFGLYAPLAALRIDPDVEPGVGELAWAELMTGDREGVWPFYQQLFGWEHAQSMDMGPMGLYWIFKVGPRPMVGAMMTKPAEMPVSAWLHYFEVADLDGAIATAMERGGQLQYGPMDVPGDKRVAAFTDPQGAWFALHGK